MSAFLRHNLIGYCGICFTGFIDFNLRYDRRLSGTRAFEPWGNKETNASICSLLHVYKCPEYGRILLRRRKKRWLISSYPRSAFDHSHAGTGSLVFQFGNRCNVDDEVGGTIVSVLSLLPVIQVSQRVSHTLRIPFYFR